MHDAAAASGRALPALRMLVIRITVAGGNEAEEAFIMEAFTAIEA